MRWRQERQRASLGDRDPHSQPEPNERTPNPIRNDVSQRIDNDGNGVHDATARDDRATFVQAADLEATDLEATDLHTTDLAAADVQTSHDAAAHIAAAAAPTDADSDDWQRLRP